MDNNAHCACSIEGERKIQKRGESKESSGNIPVADPEYMRYRRSHAFRKRIFRFFPAENFQKHEALQSFSI